MGGASAGGGGGGGNRPDRTNPNKPPVSYSPVKTKTKTKTRDGNNNPKKKETKIKQEKKNKFTDLTKEKLNPTNNVQTKVTKPKNIIEKIVDKSPVINLLKNNPISKKTEEVNRKFYEEKVVPAGKSKAPNYETYMKDRLAGKTDAYGNTLSGGGNDNTPAPTIIKKTAGGQTVQTTAPTEAELSQSAAADAEEYDLRKTKKRGRSMTTLTSSKGLTDNKLTLGKPSLLGA